MVERKGFMAILGKIEKIEDLRTIWKHEARDFSKWLSQEENNNGSAPV